MSSWYFFFLESIFHAPTMPFYYDIVLNFNFTNEIKISWNPLILLCFHLFLSRRSKNDVHSKMNNYYTYNYDIDYSTHVHMVTTGYSLDSSKLLLRNIRLSCMKHYGKDHLVKDKYSFSFWLFALIFCFVCWLFCYHMNVTVSRIMWQRGKHIFI